MLIQSGAPLGWLATPRPEPPLSRRIQEHLWVREEVRRQDEDLTMLAGARTLGPIAGHAAGTVASGGLRPVSRGLADLPM